MNNKSLSELQKTFTQLFGSNEPETMSDFFNEPPQGALADRMGVYRFAYFKRIADCVRSDFPRVNELLGEDNFTELLHRMIVTRAARSWAISEFGEELPAFLRASAEIEKYPYLADLAELEWLVAKCDCLLTPPSFDFSVITTIPEDKMDEIQLLLNPTLMTLETFWSLLDPKLARSSKGPLQIALFLNRERKVEERVLSLTEQSLLLELQKGARMGSLAETLAAQNISNEQVFELISKWVQSGLLSGIRH